MSVTSELEISVVTAPVDISVALAPPTTLEILTEEAPTIEVVTSGPPGQNGKGVLVLGISDPVPSSTPAETVIVRYERS